MMRRVLGSPGAAAVSIAAMVSIFAALNGSILTGARVPYAMARDGCFFHRLGGVSPRAARRARSILMLCLWCSVLVFSGRFEQLIHLRHLRQLDCLRP